jgi:hypothetical protein
VSCFAGGCVVKIAAAAAVDKYATAMALFKIIITTTIIILAAYLSLSLLISRSCLALKPPTYITRF